MHSEIDRCDKEIADAERLLRAGHKDVEGLTLALHDWSRERELLMDQTRKGNACLST